MKPLPASLTVTLALAAVAVATNAIPASTATATPMVRSFHCWWFLALAPLPPRHDKGPPLGGSGRLVVAVLGRPSPLKPPVDLVGARVPPLAHPVLETR